MPLRGKELNPRDIASMMFDAGWTGFENLTIALAVCLAESQGYDRAYHDNLADDGTVKSRDVGLMQINIPASEIGTKVEEDLYVPVNNIKRARELFEARGFEPWVSYNEHHWMKDPYMRRTAEGIGNFTAVHLQKMAKETTNYDSQLPVPLLTFRKV